jgi:hypothetical protein
MVVVAVAVTWRIDVHKVMRRKDEEVHFWFDQAGEAQKRGSERVDSLSFHYRVQLESMKAANDKLTEENLALRKQTTESPTPP